MKDLYLDFEYIQATDKTQFHLICGVIYDDQLNKSYKFDLQNYPYNITNYLKNLNVFNTRFYGYNIATAEVPILCQIMGRDWVLKTNWVDLWTEFKMFSLTHQKFYSEKTGLEAAIKILDLEHFYKADKGATRDIIIYDDYQRQLPEKQRKHRKETGNYIYTDAQFEQIMHYCEQDVLIMPRIKNALSTITKKYRYPITQEHIDKRGQHCKFAGIAYSCQKGYPMDVERVKTIFDNIPKIKTSIKLNCNKEIGYEIYKAKFKGPRNRKVLFEHQFNMQNLIAYFKEKGIYDEWEKTKRGLKLTQKYLDEKLSQYKIHIEPFYNAKNTIKQLNSTNLATLLTEDGYIKSESWPFNQKTSRTSPKPKLGFILNLTPWLRMLIKPKPGRAFVGIDFKSQEILIAGMLSKDDSMLDDYLTDIYIGQAIKTGFAPCGATKRTHAELRDSFKPIVLGTNFGMKEDSLGIHFFNLFNKMSQQKTLKECIREAKKFLGLHKKAYYKYDNFLQKHFKISRMRGYYQSLDGWLYFVDSKTKETQLVNVPCQSNGAAMTRIAHDECVNIGIDVIQLHDALYFECAENEAVDLAKVVSRIMCDASAKILGCEHMSTETKIFTHEIPYYDKRGEQIYRFIMQELGLECPENFPKPKEFKDIHKIKEVVL